MEELGRKRRKADGSQGEVRIRRRSSFYETKPVGYEDQPDFINAVIEVETNLTPRELLLLIQEVERALGRKRTIRWGPRTIDIDILLYDGLQVDEPDLQVPHPRMWERGFVLVPLAELVPGMKSPDGRTVRELACEIEEALRSSR